MLRVELLGTPNLTINGRAVKLGAKHISMLAYLALEGRTSRRELGQMLWADAPNVLNNISVARNLVVKALGAEALEVDTDSLALGSSVSCDVLEWRDGAAQTDAQVWNLWRGGFLTGLRLTDWEMGLGAEFEDWLFSSRETLNLERREFAARLAALEVTRDLNACASFLEVAAGGDEPHEDATRRYLLALGALGKSDQAAQVFSKLSSQLEDELGVGVTERTRFALEVVRAGETQACHEALIAEFGLKPEIVVRAISSTPFVGRIADLEHLKSLLEFQAGMIRIAIISGEPGAGKSRLALEVSAALNAPTVHVTFAPSSLPFTLLEALVRNNLSHLKTLPSDWRDALARLAPDIFDNSSLPPVLPPELERRAVFNGARALLHNSRVLIVDDLQWADAVSLEFLLALIANPPESGLAIIGTLRSTETTPEGVKTLLERIARIDLGIHHHLEPLNQNDLLELAHALNRENVDVERLQASSGGNPFYALELLRSGETSSSSRVHDLVKIRLEQLDETARQTLETLAITGNPSASNMLRRVSGRSLEEFSDAISLLERANLVRVTEDSLGFIHDLVRETVEMMLPSIRRTLLHLRAARVTREPVLAARHYFGSVNAWDDEDTLPAVNSFLAIAAQSATRGDLNLGLTWFDRALEYANQDDLRVRVLLERANALAIHGKHVEALETLDRADLRLEFLDDAVLKARALVTRALLQNRELRRPDLARINLQHALQTLENLKGVAALEIRSEALTLSSSIAHAEVRYPEAFDQGTRALQIARTLQDQKLQASALAALGLAAIALKNEHAQAYLLECLEIRERIGDVLGMGRALSNLSLHYAAQGLIDESIQTLERALEIQQRLGNTVDAAITLANIGAICFDGGRYEKAVNSYQDSVHLLELHGLNAREEVIFNLAEVEYKLGSFDQAAKRLDDLIRFTNEPYMGAAALVMRAEIALESSDTKLAIQMAQLALEKARANKWADLEVSSANLISQLEVMGKPL